MSLYKRGGVYWYEFVFKGERIRKSTETGNQNVARQIEAAEYTKLAKGESGIEERAAAPTLRAFGVKFMAQIEMDCASKPATIKFYREKLTRLQEGKLADMALDRIDENAIEAYKRGRRTSISRRGTALSPASVNRELATLRRLLRMAHEWNDILRLPKIRLLRGEVEREFVLGRQDEVRYLDALPAVMRDLAVFLVETGLRVGEALKLEWSMVKLADDPGYVTVRKEHAKSGKARVVPLTARARKILERATKKDRVGLVFKKEDGSGLYHTWLDQQHAAVRERLGYSSDFVLHSLRHTFGTRLGETGADAFTIMRLMGRSSVTVS